MKKLVSIALLLALFLPGIYKSGLVVYYQLNKEYIAANLCVNKDRPMTMCYGKCFLYKGLELTDQKSKDSGLVQLKIEISVYTLSTFSLPDYSQQEASSSFSSIPVTELPDGVSNFVFRPPLV